MFGLTFEGRTRRCCCHSNLRDQRLQFYFACAGFHVCVRGLHCVIWPNPPPAHSMAEVVFTEVALLHIRAMSATLPWVQPVVSVVWWKGTADNSRSSDGSASWRTIEAPRWYAFISDWYENVSEPDPDQLPRIDGVSVYRDKKAEEAPGTFLISLTENGLAVEQAAT
jgi:hypothetical protein